MGWIRLAVGIWVMTGEEGVLSRGVVRRGWTAGVEEEEGFAF